MTFVFKGINKTDTTVDFVYFQLRFSGGASSKRLTTTSTHGDIIMAGAEAGPSSQALQAKVYQSSLRGTTRVVVQVGLAGQAGDTRIRVAKGEKAEVRFTAVAGTSGLHKLDFSESLADSRGQNDVRKNSKYLVVLA